MRVTFQVTVDYQPVPPDAVIDEIRESLQESNPNDLANGTYEVTSWRVDVGRVVD